MNSDVYISKSICVRGVLKIFSKFLLKILLAVFILMKIAANVFETYKNWLS